MSDVYPQAVMEAVGMVGSPYLLGAKWEPGTPNSRLRGPVDCSGFSRWVLAKAGKNIPDGSYNQIGVCERIVEADQANPVALALGFYQSPGSDEIDHVVISTGTGVVVEARGEPYNCVILRPVAAWNAQPGFKGFYVVK